MKIKQFEFIAAQDGFDVIVRENAAKNSGVLAEVSITGEVLGKFVEEFFPTLDEEGDSEEESLPESTSKDWADEPELPDVAKVAPDEDKLVDETDESPSVDAKDVIEDEKKKEGWFK